MSGTRRTVSVLFCDVVDSTPLGERLDPESLRRVQTEYFSAVGDVLEGHGGLVEKFIGDAVMAVFGLPTLHEDDALRAARAASELGPAIGPIDRELERAHGLRLRIRVGVATGEVVAGDTEAGHGFATGDTVVTAERLEQAARADEVLVDDATYRLIADAVDAEPVEAVAAKGKAEPVPAWRLLGVETGALGVARRFDTPLVGRDAELAALRQELDRVAEEGRCRLVTVVGPAGIGKSRLVREFLLAVGPRATVRVGRCLPYGDGITFWPVFEVLPDETLEGTTDEIFRRVRRTLEELAGRGPLVVCFDDVHWAEPTFLNLVEYLRGWIVDAPVLIVCLARPELLDDRPQWRETSLELTPLDAREIERLLDALEAPAEARERIAEAAEGNPLFAEQVAAIAADESGELVVPRSIQLLLAARLDRLSPDERAVAEWAAVVGREFPLQAVAALAPDEARAEVSGHLFSLLRKDLVDPHAGQFWADDGFRFRSALLRDVAYEGTPKETRADLHERYARWYDRHHGEDVIVGYHLEQAYRYREELGRADERLAEEAGTLLAAAGERAFMRDDMPAAIKLLRRATNLLPPGPARLEPVRKLSTALWAAGELAEAEALRGEVLEAAVSAGDKRMQWYAVVDGLMRGANGVSEEDQARLADEAIAVFTGLDDDLGLARVWRFKSLLPNARRRLTEGAEAVERSLFHASRAGDPREVARAVYSLCTTLLDGPTPVGEAISRCEEILARRGTTPLIEAGVSTHLAGLKAMQGNFEEARRLGLRAEEIFDGLGLRLAIVNLAEAQAGVELLAGDPEEAEAALRKGYEILAREDPPSLTAPLAAMLAEAALEQGHAEQAEELLRAANQAEEIDSRVRSLRVRARLQAQRGDVERALGLAREAVQLASESDALNLRADTHVVLAGVLQAASRDDEAERELRTAVELYERKGNAVAAARAAALLAKDRLGIPPRGR